MKRTFNERTVDIGVGRLESRHARKIEGAVKTSCHCTCRWQGCTKRNGGCRVTSATSELQKFTCGPPVFSRLSPVFCLLLPFNRSSTDRRTFSPFVSSRYTRLNEKFSFTTECAWWARRWYESLGTWYHSRAFVGLNKAEYWLNRAAHRLRADN